MCGPATTDGTITTSNDPVLLAVGVGPAGVSCYERRSVQDGPGLATLGSHGIWSRQLGTAICYLSIYSLMPGARFDVDMRVCCGNGKDQKWIGWAFGTGLAVHMEHFTAMGNLPMIL